MFILISFQLAQDAHSIILRLAAQRVERTERRDEYRRSTRAPIVPANWSIIIYNATASGLPLFGGKELSRLTNTAGKSRLGM